MDPFWNNIYDDVKDRRYGTLFFTTLLIGTPLVILGLFLVHATFADFRDFLAGLPGISTFQIVCLVLLAALALMAMAMFWRHWVKIGRKAREDRLKYSNLSRDELLKARSKLKNNMKPVQFRAVERPGKPVALRAPDTDLKY